MQVPAPSPGFDAASPQSPQPVLKGLATPKQIMPLIPVHDDFLGEPGT